MFSAQDNNLKLNYFFLISSLPSLLHYREEFVMGAELAAEPKWNVGPSQIFD